MLRLDTIDQTFESLVQIVLFETWFVQQQSGSLLQQVGRKKEQLDINKWARLAVALR